MDWAQVSLWEPGPWSELADNLWLERGGVLRQLADVQAGADGFASAGLAAEAARGWVGSVLAAMESDAVELEGLARAVDVFADEVGAVRRAVAVAQGAAAGSGCWIRGDGAVVPGPDKESCAAVGGVAGLVGDALRLAALAANALSAALGGVTWVPLPRLPATDLAVPGSPVVASLGFPAETPSPAPQPPDPSQQSATPVPSSSWWQDRGKVWSGPARSVKFTERTTAGGATSPKTPAEADSDYAAGLEFNPYVVPPPAPRPASGPGWAEAVAAAETGVRLGYVLGAGALAWNVETHTGGQCYWDQSRGLGVCAGGKMPAGRGGTTIGFTFVSRQTDPQTQQPLAVNALKGADFAKLLDHEARHVRQGEELGPLFPILYFADEAATHLVDPSAQPGCLNVFEQQAGLADGNYRCP